VWRYTPREIAGWTFYAARRQQRRSVEQTVIGFNAARGDPKAIKKQVKELERD